MPLRILFEGSVPKHIDSPDDNEDAYRLAPDRGRVVLSDGASESFDARSWARLLVEQTINAELSIESLAGCVSAYEQLHEPSLLSWSKAAAFERGSFATLLVAQDRPADRFVSVTVIGDSFAVLTDGQQLLDTFPYRFAQQFEQRPVLISTRNDMNSVLDDNEGIGSRVEWAHETQGYRILMCMTDALGAWLLSHEERGDGTALERLHAIREPAELLSLVELERKAGNMRRDDTTLIIAALVSMA